MHEQAERQYQTVLAIDSTAAVAANNLAYRYAEGNRNLSEALRLAETARQRLPADANTSDTLGWVHFKLGSTRLAIRELEVSVRENPNDPLNRYHLGLAYKQDGEVDKAIESLRAALKLNPNFPEADAARQALASLGGSEK